MREAVSDILIDRAREADGLARMVVYSLAVHAALIAGLVVMPASWRTARVNNDEAAMTITLGGAPGPDQGMTTIANRAVQAVAPPDAKPIAQPAPAAKPPEMVAPITTAKPVPKTPPKIEKPEAKSSSRRPTTGAEVKSGAARIETGGAQVPFGGLATGGGGDGATVVGVTNFCCVYYLVTMKQIIQRHWDPNQGVAGDTEVRFTILRDGTITEVKIDKSSGFAVLDQAALRAVMRTPRLPTLPREFPDNKLTIILVFPYQR
jgi:TonB family protein